MAMHTGTVQRQQQTVGMVPEHLLGKSVLKMGLQELQQFVEVQVAENPALIMEEDSLCPACGCALLGDYCPGCGSEKIATLDDTDSDGEDWQEGMYSSAGHAEDEYYEPFARVAAPKLLAEHLKEQVRVSKLGDKEQIAEFLIDCLDEDGYLREPLIDIASRFGVSVPQLEEVLRLIQALDPPGVGARDLRECLLIQIEQLDDDSGGRILAEKIIRDHWEGVSRMKLERVASVMGVEVKAVTRALTYMREHVTPHPAAAFRDPWEKLTPRRESRHVPDVLVRVTEHGLMTEILDPITGKAAIDETYGSLYAEVLRKKNGFAEADRAHIKECVRSARTLIEALEFRKDTLQRLAAELIRCQVEFIIKGPAYLKPLTRKELAARIGVHESTVCRATSEKTMQLPSGEVVSFDIFFDSALPVREMVRSLAAEYPNGKALSDSEIAERLNALGVIIARRTVAKYRDQLRLLPVEYRLAT